MTTPRRGLAAITTLAAIGLTAFGMPGSVAAQQDSTVLVAKVAVSDAVPDERLPVPLKLLGAQTGAGLVMRVNVLTPEFYEEYGNCVTTDGVAGELTCVWPDLDIQAGQAYQLDSGTPLAFEAPVGSPGPVDLCRGLSECGYSAQTIGTEAARQLLADIGGGMEDPLNLAVSDDSGDWAQRAEIGFVTAANGADIAAEGVQITGPVGAEVTFEVGAANLGPAWWIAPVKAGSPAMIVTVPSGLTITQKPEYCHETAARTYACTVFEMQLNSATHWSFSAEVTSANPAGGKVFFDTEPSGDTWYDVNLDDNQQNNSAAINLN